MYNKIVIEEGTPVVVAEEILEEVCEEIAGVKARLECLRHNHESKIPVDLDHLERLSKYYVFLKIKENKYERYIKRATKKQG